MGKQTSNHYLRAAKQFTRWLKKSRRVDEDPLADVPMLNVQTDRRHDRRALHPEELARLIAAADAGQSVESVTGSDRAMMYVLSAWTGYRKGEIGSLTRRSFDLEADQPTVTVQAVYSKRRRTDTQALHQDVAARLREWLATKPAAGDALLFPISGKVPGGVERKTAKMMRIDLAAARKRWLDEAMDEAEREGRERSDFLAYRGDDGRFADFHANRHTFITNLGKAGVSPKTAQSLARHSDIRLTMNIYTHTDMAEKAAAVNRLAGPRERYGSAPGSQTGKNGQPMARDGSEEKETADRERSAEVEPVSELVASLRSVAADDRTAPQRIRTSNLRFRRPTLYPIELGVRKVRFAGPAANAQRSWQNIDSIARSRAVGGGRFLAEPPTSTETRSDRFTLLRVDAPMTARVRAVAVLRRIVAAGAPGVAAEDPPHAAEHAGDGPVLPHGFDRVVAARWMEAAAAAEQRAQHDLIEPHPGDHSERRQAAESLHWESKRAEAE